MSTAAVNQFEQAKKDIVEEAQRTAQQFAGSDPVEQEEMQEGIKNTIQLMREKVESDNHAQSHLTLLWIYHMTTAVDLI